MNKRLFEVIQDNTKKGGQNSEAVGISEDLELNNESTNTIENSESKNEHKKSLDGMMFLSVSEVADILGISRSFLNTQLNSNSSLFGFNVVVIGARKLIPYNSFKKWYDSLKN